jgi:glycosyltransferase involved in cell wall biosynthesis
MTTTVHLVYPHGNRVSCPDAIGRNVGKRLERQHTVAYHDVTETRAIRPEPGDILLGHPHPYPWTVFQRSMRQKGWKRVIAMSPYHHGDGFQVAFLDSCLPYCDEYLAITGNHWFSTIEQSPFAHWRPRMEHLDLAIDRSDFPVVKERFNAAGQRKFVYIGSLIAPKNTGYLGKIASRMSGAEFAWIGAGRGRIAGVRSLGYLDFAAPASRQFLAEYDFMITTGSADANPATILESMAWGLIPVCTPQSGYVGYPGIVNIPLNDPPAAVDILKKLQEAPDDKLHAMQAANWKALDEHFNWDRFARQVSDSIRGSSHPALGPESVRKKMQLRLLAWTAPYSPLNPLQWVRRIKRFAARKGS